MTLEYPLVKGENKPRHFSSLKPRNEWFHAQMHTQSGESDTFEPKERDPNVPAAPKFAYLKLDEHSEGPEFNERNASPHFDLAVTAEYSEAVKPAAADVSDVPPTKLYSMRESSPERGKISLNKNLSKRRLIK